MNIIEHGPEIPDPTQLDLFDFGAQEPVTVQNSTDSGEGSQTNETMIRSPTSASDLITSETERKFNQAQIILAGSLHRMSRELVQKSKEKHFELIEEENNSDLAR
jgi:hypothetical protein